MGHIILDGEGSQRAVGVNEAHEMKVHSTALDMQNVSEAEGTAYVCYLKRNVTGSGNEGIGVMTYNGDKKAYISQIHCSSNGTTSNIEGFFSPFTSGPTGGTAHTAINLNRGSTQASDMVIVTGATDITITEDDTLEFFNARLSINGTSSYLYPVNGSIILEKGDSIAILGSSGTIGDKLRVQVWWFESDGES